MSSKCPLRHVETASTEELRRRDLYTFIAVKQIVKNIGNSRLFNGVAGSAVQNANITKYYEKPAMKS